MYSSKFKGLVKRKKNDFKYKYYRSTYQFRLWPCWEWKKESLIMIYFLAAQPVATIYAHHIQ